MELKAPIPLHGVLQQVVNQFEGFLNGFKMPEIFLRSKSDECPIDENYLETWCRLPFSRGIVYYNVSMTRTTAVPG